MKGRTGAEGEAARRAAVRERRGGAEGEAARCAAVREREEHSAWLLGEEPPIERAPIEPAPIEELPIEAPWIEVARARRQASHRAVVRAVRWEERRPRRATREALLERLTRATRAVAHEEARLSRVRRYRDGQVALLRELGVSWERIAAAAGVSRQALVKRQG